MTNEECIKMLKAKLKCMERSDIGTEECNMLMCDNCSLNYEQGNMGEQKEALKKAIKALEKQKTGKWIGTEYDFDADGNPVYDVFECSLCGCEHQGESDTLTDYCPDCGARMNAPDTNVGSMAESEDNG